MHQRSRVDSSATLMHSNPSDLGSLINPKERILCFSVVDLWFAIVLEIL